MQIDPMAVAGVNARSAMIPGGLVDGLAQLTAALMRAPHQRRERERQAADEARQQRRLDLAEQLAIADRERADEDRQYRRKRDAVADERQARQDTEASLSATAKRAAMAAELEDARSKRKEDLDAQALADALSAGRLLADLQGSARQAATNTITGAYDPAIADQELEVALGRLPERVRSQFGKVEPRMNLNPGVRSEDVVANLENAFPAPPAAAPADEQVMPATVQETVAGMTQPPGGVRPPAVVDLNADIAGQPFSAYLGDDGARYVQQLATSDPKTYRKLQILLDEYRAANSPTADPMWAPQRAATTQRLQEAVARIRQAAAPRAQAGR